MSTLLSRLKLLYPDASASSIRNWIRVGRVSVNGSLVTKEVEPVEPSATIELLPREKKLTKSKIQVLYQDRDLIVLSKPVGLLSVNLDEGDDLSLHAILKVELSLRKVYPIHRLDRETSGVIVFALNEQTRDRLKDALQKREIKRTYHAIVENRPAFSKGTWKHLLEENRYLKMEVVPTGGIEAVTHYTVLASNAALAHLELQLETGRKNQIRVQSSYEGHPIAGDKKYGSRWKHSRMLLHAYKLDFLHPTSGKKMHFESPLPEEFIKMIAVMKS